jgi:hypothetical protein
MGELVLKRIIDSYLQAWAQQASFKPLLLGVCDRLVKLMPLDN